MLWRVVNAGNVSEGVWGSVTGLLEGVSPPPYCLALKKKNSQGVGLRQSTDWQQVCLGVLGSCLYITCAINPRTAKEGPIGASGKTVRPYEVFSMATNIHFHDRTLV